MNFNKCFIIAEIGSTHNGDFDLAKKLIDVVAETGADAAKFQTHIAEAETLRNAPPPPFFDAEPRFEYFKRTGFTPEEWRELKEYAESRGLVFISSSFSIPATELLESLDVRAHKVPSGEVTNIPYLEHLSKTGKPVFLSSGMSNWEELDEAVEALKKHRDDYEGIVLLQCTTEYPVRPEGVGLNVMHEMKDRYGTHVGLSDHSLHNYAAFAAVAHGAKVVEKHITISRDMYGSDAKHSMLPEEFKELVDGIRTMEAVLQSRVDKDDIEKFGEMKEVFQKSIVTDKHIRAGETITEGMLTTKKPGTGIAPRELSRVIGKKAVRDLPMDHMISWEDFVE